MAIEQINNEEWVQTINVSKGAERVLDKLNALIGVSSSTVNFSQVGGIGDGVSDDTPAFLQALNDYDSIFLPPDFSWKITATISLSGKRIFGVRPHHNGTTLTKGTVINGNIAISGDNNIIESIGVVNPSGNGITIRDNASQNRIMNCLFSVQNHAVLIEAFGGSATGNGFYNCESYGGIHGFVSKAKNTTFAFCKAYSPSEDGFAIVADNITGAAYSSNCLDNSLISPEVYTTNIGINLYSRDYYSTNNANAITLRGVSIIGGIIDGATYGILVGDEAAPAGGRTHNDVLNIVISGVNIQNCVTSCVQLARSNGVNVSGNIRGLVNKNGTLCKNLKLGEINGNFSLGNSVYNTINTVNATSIDANIVNEYCETNNTANTVITSILNGKVGQVLKIFINDDYTTINPASSIGLSQPVKGKGSFVTLKLSNDGSKWNELFYKAVGYPYPHKTEAQRLAMVNPSAGLHVYQTDAGASGEGVYVYKSTGWVKAY